MSKEADDLTRGHPHAQVVWVRPWPNSAGLMECTRGLLAPRAPLFRLSRVDHQHIQREAPAEQCQVAAKGTNAAPRSAGITTEMLRTDAVMAENLILAEG